MSKGNAVFSINLKEYTKLYVAAALLDVDNCNMQLYNTNRKNLRRIEGQVCWYKAQAEVTDLSKTMRKHHAR